MLGLAGRGGVFYFLFSISGGGVSTPQLEDAVVWLPNYQQGTRYYLGR